MMPKGATFLRFAILELLVRNKEGANLAQLSKALKYYDGENRLGGVFMTLRESGEIQETDARGVYVISDSGRVWHMQQKGAMSLPETIFLPARARTFARTTPGTVAGRSAYRPEPVERKPFELPMRTERPSPFKDRRLGGKGLRDWILDCLTESDKPLSPAQIYADVCEDQDKPPNRSAFYMQLSKLLGEEQLVASGVGKFRQYTIPSRVAELEEAPSTSPPRAAKPRPKPAPVPAVEKQSEFDTCLVLSASCMKCGARYAAQALRADWMREHSARTIGEMIVDAVKRRDVLLFEIGSVAIRACTCPEQQEVA